MLDMEINQLRYTEGNAAEGIEGDTAEDMANKTHGIVDVIEAEAMRWQNYRMHLLSCPDVLGMYTFGQCQWCREMRAELATVPEHEARHHEAEAAWSGHYAHSHGIRTINWHTYAELVTKLCDTITTTRQAARKLLIDDAELTERAVTTLADALSELGGMCWEEVERQEALMTECTEAYQAWMTQYRALVNLVTSDESLFFLGSVPTSDRTSINFVMYVVRLRSLDTQRPNIDDYYNRVVQTVDEARRGERNARK
jgi:hypothetical protein